MFSHFRYAAVSLLIASAGAAPLPEEADSSFNKRFSEAVGAGGFPSLVVGAIRGGDVVYERAFGVKDRSTNEPAKIDTLYRVGSVGKVFTATLLMQLRDARMLSLDDPVEKYLPSGVHLQHQAGGAADITFRHLATHSSGLAEWPSDNPKLYDSDRPESVVEQYSAFTKDPLQFPIGAHFSYSGLGYSILGHALELIGGSSYEQLLQTRLFDPLKMPDTVITLSAEQQARLPNHYTWDNKVVAKSPANQGPRWEYPTSAHFSTVPDMLRFLSLQLRSEADATTPVSTGTLAEMHTPQRLQNNWNDAIGFGWWVTPDAEIGDIVWHKGGSQGFGSYAAFSKRHNLGVVVFTNRNKSVEEIGRWFLIELAKTVGVAKPPSRTEADAFWSWRDWSDAAWAYSFAVKANPKDGEAWRRLASAHLRMRQYKNAMPAYEKAISLSQKPGDGYVQYSLARCYAGLGQREKAIAELRRAVKAGFRDEDDELLIEPEFETIRSDSAFREIVVEVRKLQKPSP